jgi:hypothetical protein
MTMTTRHRLPLRRLLASLTLVAAVATGCGSDAGTAAQPAAADAPSATGFAALFNSYRGDYDLLDSPAALANRSTVVVQGRIDRIDQGRTFGTSATDPVARFSVVLVLNVDRVLHGTLAGDKVYVELPAPRAIKADLFDRFAPKTSATVLYLLPAATKANTAIVNPDAGRPAGQPLYQPINPQGFYIESDKSVVQIMERIEFPGTSLRDFVPTAERFPTERGTPDQHHHN